MDRMSDVNLNEEKYQSGQGIQDDYPQSINKRSQAVQKEGSPPESISASVRSCIPPTAATPALSLRSHHSDYNLNYQHRYPNGYHQSPMYISGLNNYYGPTDFSRGQMFYPHQDSQRNYNPSMMNYNYPHPGPPGPMSYHGMNQSFHSYNQSGYRNQFNRALGTSSPYNFNFHNQTMPSMPSMSSVPPMPSRQTSFHPPMSVWAGDNMVNPRPNFLEWLDFYTRWYNRFFKKDEDGIVQRQRLTPKLYLHPHPRVSFGPLNQLIVISGKNVICHQMQPHLIDFQNDLIISRWPGPLSKSKTDKSEVLEFIQAQVNLREEDSLESHKDDKSIQDNLDQYDNPVKFVNYLIEKKQIWQILLMLVKQNGVISCSDLAEFLVSHNLQEFQFIEESEICKFRKLLTLGQKKNALDFASRKKLWDHAMTLTYLSSPKSDLPETCPDNMFEIVKKFFNDSLNQEDPLFVLYQSLLLNQINLYHNVSKSVPVSNLHQFTILIANECEVTSFAPGICLSELLKFIIALRNNMPQHVINCLPSGDEETKIKYFEEMVFLNELFEYGRNMDQFIFDIIPYKVLLAIKLFDYGFFNQAKKYCECLRNISATCQANTEIKVNWKLMNNILDEIENRLSGYSNDTLDVSSNTGRKVSFDSSNEIDNQYEFKTLSTIEPSKEFEPVEEPLSIHTKSTKPKIHENTIVRDTEKQLQSENKIKTSNTPNIQETKFFTPSSVNPQPLISELDTLNISEPNFPRQEVDNQEKKESIGVNNNNIEQINYAFNSTEIHNDFKKQCQIISPSLSPIASSPQIVSSPSSNVIKTDKENKNESKTMDNIEDWDNEKECRTEAKYNRFLSFFLNGRSKQALLPEDRDPQFVWDDNLKKWIDKTKMAIEQETSSVPPNIPLMNSAKFLGGGVNNNGFQFTDGKKFKSKRYVDILQKG